MSVVWTVLVWFCRIVAGAFILAAIGGLFAIFRERQIKRRG